MKEKMELIIGSMTGDYTEDLNKISDAIERAMDEGDQELVLALIEYGRSRMEGHTDKSSEQRESNYRSQDYEWGLTKDTLPKYYEHIQRAMALIGENKLEESVKILQEIRQWLLTDEELDANPNLYSFQSIFDEAIFKKLLWKEEDQLLPPEEQMFYSLYGSLLFEVGKLAEAHKILERSIDLNPVESMSYLLLSHLENMDENEIVAKRYNRLALDYGYIAEDFSEGLVNEGRFAQAEGKPELAYRFYELALDYDPSNTNVHWCIEDLYEKVPNVSRGEDEVFDAYVKAENIRLTPRKEIIELLHGLMLQFEEEENWELAMTACQFLEALPLSGMENYHQKLHDYMDRLEQEN